MKKDTAIVWFRQDLRLHDNEALWEAYNAAYYVIPVYIFDTRNFEKTSRFGFKKTAVFRAQFILDSVQDLKKSFKKRGLDLIVRVGLPEEILPELANDHKASWIYCNRERTQEELDVQNAVEKGLWQRGKELRYSRGKMLYYTADLPFPIAHTPDVFSNFRKEVERFIQVREPIPSERIAFHQLMDKPEAGSLPSLEDLGYSKSELDQTKVFEGGEVAGLARLRYYLWETDHVAQYKLTRNASYGTDYSSRFSPYLALGCLSPKMIYNEIIKYEDERKSNDSTHWLRIELLWRDFFRLMGKKHENAIFQLGGTQQRDAVQDQVDQELFERWATGQTGVPFVDSNMRELISTGFMSNRGRQNVASFLIHDLKQNWLIGAEFFESYLIDYDPCSNYGNWNYLAGVGADPREDRYFNIYTQAKRYDAEAEHIRHWIPELSQLDISSVFLPDQADEQELHKAGVVLGETYPLPLVPTKHWL